MKEINVKALKREGTGKKAAKDLRKQGLVPCNLYGEVKDENGKPAAQCIAIADKRDDLRHSERRRARDAGAYTRDNP